MSDDLLSAVIYRIQDEKKPRMRGVFYNLNR